ncbi:alpha/beta fold hydrolase [Algicella marina]|uniref:Alpha/beta hydrolase n=1 Tax=Algicella marina TaxID=2683284 RepID=A0A6P1T498_9RHOB|nr:alpha/beta hydrolase [Algicella marina]QHQ36530.1 hypothetical protein GO499_15795 [Algicella marina]
MLNLRKGIQRIRERLRTECLFEDGTLYISAIPGTGTEAVVVFTSLNGNYAARGGQSEFIGTASKGGERACIFVTDKTQSWYQTKGLAEKVVEVVRGQLDAWGSQRVLAVGYSMGAYGAMRLAKRLGVHSVLAFGPQYHPDPELVPGDPRWPEERGAIAEFTLGPVGEEMSDDIAYYVLHGRQGCDILHWSRFPQGPNIRHFIVPMIGHAVTPKLKEAGALPALFDAAFEDRFQKFRKVIWQVKARLRQPGETWETHPNHWYYKEILKVPHPDDVRGAAQ